VQVATSANLFPETMLQAAPAYTTRTTGDSATTMAPYHADMATDASFNFVDTLAQAGQVADTATNASATAPQVDLVMQIAIASAVIALLSVAIAAWSLYLQFLYQGRLKFSPIKAFGLWINYSGTIPERAITTGEPNFVSCIIPIVSYNTGNRHKEVTDFRIQAHFGGRNIIMISNHYMKGLGMGQDGAHAYPAEEGWAHQAIVRPKAAAISYIELFSTPSADDVPYIKRLDSLSFDVQVKTFAAKDYNTVLSFGVDVDEVRANNHGNNYCVYKAIDSSET
jgi:hypothetical protein